MTGKLFILTGASMSGKTTVMDLACESTNLNIVPAAKYSDRESRGDNDDIEHRDEINVEEYDITYIINGQKYGIRTDVIRSQLDSGRNAAIVLSDFRNVRRLRDEFRDRVVCIYVSAELSAEKQLQIHGDRYGFEPKDDQKIEMAREISKLKSAANIRAWKQVHNAVSDLLDKWWSYMPESRTLQIRSEKKRDFDIRYADNIEIFDHVILNYREIGELRSQIEKIVKRHSVDHCGVSARESTLSRLFVLIAASGAGKGTVMEAVNTVVGDRVRLVTKEAKRAYRTSDKRDGMRAIGPSGTFSEGFNINWTFHKTELFSGIEYAVSQEEIERNLTENVHQIVVSNFQEIDRFREKYGDRVVVVYLHSARPLEVVEQEQRLKCEEREAESRIREIQQVFDHYVERIGEVDHVLLNTAFPEDVYNQMFRLVDSYDAVLNYSSRNGMS